MNSHSLVTQAIHNCHSGNGQTTTRLHFPRPMPTRPQGAREARPYVRFLYPCGLLTPKAEDLTCHLSWSLLVRAASHARIYRLWIPSGLYPAGPTPTPELDMVQAIGGKLTGVSEGSCTQDRTNTLLYPYRPLDSQRWAQGAYSNQSWNRLQDHNLSFVRSEGIYQEQTNYPSCLCKAGASLDYLHIFCPMESRSLLRGLATGRFMASARPSIRRG